MKKPHKVKSWCPVFKDLEALKKRLERGICWGDWIKVSGKLYKMVEYGDGLYDNYMLFQNKTTKRMIEIRYQVPTSHYDKVTKERIEDRRYRFDSLEDYQAEELYRY